MYMPYNRVLKQLGFESWVIRDLDLFTYYSASGKVCEIDKYILIYGEVSQLDSILILLPEGQTFTKIINNFCKYLLIGYDFNIVVLQNSSKGKALGDIVDNKQIRYVISFVEYQKDTSNLNNNVLILNNIDFSKLESSIAYKKQVLLDVLRVSIPPAGDK